MSAKRPSTTGVRSGADNGAFPAAESLEVFGPDSWDGVGAATALGNPPTPLEAFLTAAHELRSPLAWLSGEAEGLWEQTIGSLNPAQLKAARRIADMSHRLQRIVEDCLAYGRLEKGEVPFVADLCDVDAHMRELAAAWAPAFAKKGVALHARSKGGLCSLPCDSSKLLRIISILLENALQFTPAGGEAELTWQLCIWARREGAEPEVEPARQNANAVCISVRDSGVGIAPENQMEIFEPFVSLRRGESAAGLGLGLGLAVARRLVQWHGGKIWVESKLGQGSTFAVMLPLPPTG